MKLQVIKEVKRQELHLGRQEYGMQHLHMLQLLEEQKHQLTKNQHVVIDGMKHQKLKEKHRVIIRVGQKLLEQIVAHQMVL